MPESRVHTLPDRPDHPLYLEELVDIENDPNPARSRKRMREFVEQDLWAFNKWVMSFGEYTVADSDHPRYGKLWVDDPWVFDRCRELQYDSETGVEDKFYNWSRYFFKTELITKNLSLWELVQDLLLTFGFFIHKVDQAGDQIFSGGIKTEIERNAKLVLLWPHAFRKDVKEYPLWTNTACTIIRPLGPREPTFSIHGIDHLPTSGHYRREVFDDAVVQKTVATPKAIRAGIARIQEATALGQDDTLSRHVGTTWDADDPNMQNVKQGVVVRDHRPALVHADGLVWTSTSSVDDPKWVPQLRSRSFLRKWRRKLGAYSFSCQMMGTPIAKNELTFDPAWLKTYESLPADKRLRGNRYMIVDPAGVKGSKKSDFWVFRIVELRADRNTYTLDLWRERMTLIDATHLLFALVRLWEPKKTWLEETGAQGFDAAFKDEMQRRGFRFSLGVIRSAHWQRHTAKEDRILLLQPSYERGERWYPGEGFKHGSGPLYIDALRAAVQDPTLEGQRRTRVDDKRDTFVQFREDEYTKWTPVPGSTLYDDCLDNEAWLVQDETSRHFRFPEAPEQPDYRGAGAFPRTQQTARQGYPGGLSEWTW